MASHPTTSTDGGSAGNSPSPSGRSLAIISGAAAGIGLAVLRSFLAHSWECVALDIDAAAKGALVAWSRQLVSELASANVLINTVCPGIIGTERILGRWQRRSAAENSVVMSRIPLGRLGTPAEIAEVIYFLGSANNTY